MKTYTIHEPYSTQSDLIEWADEVQFVKEGFAWWALIAPFLWLIYHRMWLVLIALFCVMIIVQGGLSLVGTTEVLNGFMSFFISLVFAFEANNLRRWELSRRDFQMIAAVVGKDRQTCEIKFFTSWLEDMDLSSDLGHIAATLTEGSAAPAPDFQHKAAAKQKRNAPLVLGDLKS